MLVDITKTVIGTKAENYDVKDNKLPKLGTLTVTTA